MRILLDECLPRRLKAHLVAHDCRTVPEMGWAGKWNGELLELAEDGYDVFLTLDKGVKYQQNLSGRGIAVGTPGHSALQTILVVYLATFERSLGIAVRPECRTRIEQTRYRIPDVLVLKRPFRQTDKVVFDAPLLIIEILSPEDRTRDSLRRFRDYEHLGVRYIVQMDQEDRTTHVFINGDLVHRDLTVLETPDGPLPFDTRDLLARLDDETSN